MLGCCFANFPCGNTPSVSPGLYKRRNLSFWGSLQTLLRHSSCISTALPAATMKVPAATLVVLLTTAALCAPASASPCKSRFQLTARDQSQTLCLECPSHLIHCPRAGSPRNWNLRTVWICYLPACCFAQLFCYFDGSLSCFMRPVGAHKSMDYCWWY